MESFNTRFRTNNPTLRGRGRNANNSEKTVRRFDCHGGRQDEDLTDTTLSAHFHAGPDYRGNERVLKGFKFTCSMMCDKEAEVAYESHLVTDLTNAAEMTGMNHWSVTLSLRYPFGE